MRRIRNPFAENNNGDYCCFGCAPGNKFGLNLEFWDRGEEVVAFWTPETRFEGFHDVVHGGIQSTLMDEIASWYIFAKCGTAGVTSGMDIRFLKPLRVSGGEVMLSARLREHARRFATVACKLTDKEGNTYASADVRYYLFPESEAREKFRYPGAAAFFTE